MLTFIPVKTYPMKKYLVAIVVLTLSLLVNAQERPKVYNFTISYMTLNDGQNTIIVDDETVKDRIISVSFIYQKVQVNTSPPKNFYILEAGTTTEDEEGTTFQIKCRDQDQKGCRIYLSVPKGSTDTKTIGVQYSGRTIIYFVKPL